MLPKYVNFPETDFYSLFIQVAEKKNCERKIFVAYFCNPVNFQFDLMMKLIPYLGHVVTFTLISILVTDYIQKRLEEPGLFTSLLHTKFDKYQSKSDYLHG